MLTEQEIQDLRQGTFEIDCSLMVLKRISTGNMRAFSGPGFVKQSSGDEIYFKLYPDAKFHPDELFRQFYSPSSMKLGEVIPEHEYYSLSATDLQGRRWTSSRILPPNIHQGEGVVLTGRLDELIHTTDRVSHLPRRGYLVLRVFDDIKIPVNTTTETTVSVAGKELTSHRLNASKFTSCGKMFRLTQEDGFLTIEVISDDESLPDHIEKRVIEALQFVLARPLRWSVMQKYCDGIEKTCIRPQRSVVSKPRLQPPINFHSPAVTESVWKLFDRYLQHIITHSEDKWHPLSVEIHSVCEASGGSLDAEGLTLGVAIEGVLRSEFPNLGWPSKDTKSAVKRFFGCLEECDVDESLKGRIKGAVGNMFRPRPKDRMLLLIDEGAIIDEQLRAWESLRHSSAHAERPDSKSLQDFLQLCWTVTVLLYHLVFRAIGYEGKYTDYSADGWPLKQYPPKPEGVQPESEA